MTRIYLWSGRNLLWVVMILLLTFLTWALGGNQSITVVGVEKTPETKEFTIITTEYKTKLENGKEIESYRWNPGNIIIHKGDRVTLRFLGIHGQSHPFVIKGLEINGEVKKGEETKVTFVANKAGTYQLICLAHPTVKQHGPMIGYIHVLED